MDISGIKVIDAMVMENPPRVLAKPHSRRAAEVDGLFHDFAERSTRGSTTEEMIAEMREMGIEKGILEVATTHHEDYDQDSGIQAVRKYPEVFVPYASDFSVNPKDGMLAVRRLELLVKKYGAKLLHIMSSRIGAPPSDKMFYPLFAKCIELDIPVTLNVGIPGPNYPARFQDPIHIDEICWFFPELKVVMTHGGEPWQFMCVKLMLKWPNLYYMTNAIVPKHYPEEVIYYLNTRGADKVMFATAYPLVSFKRAMTEVKDLPLRDHVWPKFLRENAAKVFKL